MILPLGGFGGVGFPLGIAPLSLSSPSLSTDAFGSLSLGASNFAMSNPAMSLIAQGYGTGRSSYSPFGVSGMYGSIGLGAPMLGGLNFAGPGPNFLNMNELFMQLWNATFGPKQSMPGGSSQASAPQPVADDTGNVGGARKTGKADEADEDKADGATGAGQAKGDAAKSDWKTTVGNAFKGTGARVAGTDEKEGKKVVRLEPDTNDPKTSRSKLARALQTLHRNGVQTAMIGDDAVQTGHRVTSKTKKNAKGQFIKTWEPNTRGVMRALDNIAPKASPAPPAAVTPTADASAPAGDVGAALVEPLRKVTAATYAVPADNKSHRIVVKVDKGAQAGKVAGLVVAALNTAGRSMGAKAASDQRIQVAFLGDKTAAESAQKEFDAQYRKNTNPNLPVIISIAGVKKTST